MDVIVRGAVEAVRNLEYSLVQEGGLPYQRRRVTVHLPDVVLTPPLGEGLSKIGKRIGLSTSTLTLARTSKNGIPSEYIRRIVEEYPQVNMCYLVTGEGDVLRSDGDVAKGERQAVHDIGETIRKLEQAEFLIGQLKTGFLSEKCRPVADRQ